VRRDYTVHCARCTVFSELDLAGSRSRPAPTVPGDSPVAPRRALVPSALAMPVPSEPVLRAASVEDVDAIAALWHHGWIDGHLGHVPEALHAHRRWEDFLRRVPPRIPITTVATLGRELIGFVTVQDDEIEQLYVAASARGGGIAAVLLRHGEQVIAGKHATAWLAVAVGNARARRFYARQGWSDAAALDYPAETATGPIAIPCRRYEKIVR